MKTLFLLMAIIPMYLFGQEITKTIQSKTFGKISATYGLSITESKDSTFFIYVTYKNLQYQHIIDIGGFGFFNKEDADSFISTMHKMIPLAGTDIGLATKVTEDYTIKCGVNPNVFFYDKDGKHTYISKANALKLTNWVETLSFH